MGLVGHGQARQRPLLWVHLPPDLHVHHFNFLAVLQGLDGRDKSSLRVLSSTLVAHFQTLKTDSNRFLMKNFAEQQNKPTSTVSVLMQLYLSLPYYHLRVCVALNLLTSRMMLTSVVRACTLWKLAMRPMGRKPS